MFKRTIAAMMILAAVLCLAVKADAADARHTKDDTWLVYWYICGTNLEEENHYASLDIAEMQQVKLPPNVKILIAAGGAKVWHHPTLNAGGNGIYLYSSNRLEKQADWNGNANMGDPNTLANFLKYGEENFPADHKVLIFWNHGSQGGVIYDDDFPENVTVGNQSGSIKASFISYDELNATLDNVYGTGREELPLELIGFKACLTGSYELANSIADFAHYMVGAEPFVYDWPVKPFIATLANDPSINGAQIGKVICDSAIKNYDPYYRMTHSFAVVDLTKMPILREAYEEYFDEAARRSNEEVGFNGAFARAVAARNVDKFSNVYADLWLVAKNTKSIMPAASKKLLRAIDKAVIYNKHGDALNGKGLSTYYPLTSSEKSTVETNSLEFDTFFLQQNSNYSAQKSLYKELLKLNVEKMGTVPVEVDAKNHIVAQLTPEQLENVSSVTCLIAPLNIATGNAMVLTSADDLTVDWKKGIVRDNFRAVRHVFDGHEISMFSTEASRGHTFYDVPIKVNGDALVLKVRYDMSTGEYLIFGFGSDIENGVVRSRSGTLKPGDVVTPIITLLVAEENLDPADTVISKYKNPTTGGNVCIVRREGTPFIYTRTSAITDRKLGRGGYVYSFLFHSPKGQIFGSDGALIAVDGNNIYKFNQDDLARLQALFDKNKK